MKILAIGGCGSMGRYAIRAVQNFSSVDEIIIADIDKESAGSFAASLNQKVSAIQLDVSDAIALKQAKDSGQLKPNMNIMLMGFGVGLSIAGCIVRS